MTNATMLPLGKRPATYDKHDLRLSDHLTTIRVPTAPKPGGGYGMDFGSAGWQMLGNGPCDDGSVDPSFAAYGGGGDCAWAGPGHEEMESAKNAGRPIPRFTCLNILKQYSAYSGYDLQTGANDNGSDLREVLNWRQKRGLLDADGKVYKIGIYVSLEPSNLQQLWQALWLFENVGIGLRFPSSAMDQFNNSNQIWSVVAGAQIEGGHYVPLVGHPVQSAWTCVSWGHRQMMTENFLKTYCDEAWAYIDPLRYNRVTGKTNQNFDNAELNEYIAVVGQQLAA